MATLTPSASESRTVTSTVRRAAKRPLAIAAVMALVAVAGFLLPPTRSADADTVSLLNCEFGKFQAFDVQWNIQGDVLNVSSVVPPFSSYPSPHPLTIEPPDPELTDTDYFKFVATDYVVPDPNPNGETAIGFNLYAQDGTLKQVMQEWGVFRAYGPGFIFYLGEGFWGTVITTGEALEYGSSASLPITRNSDSGAITEAEMLDYQCQGSPLPPPGQIPVTVTAPTESMTAGNPVPDLTPTVEPAEGLTEDPTCAVYESSDTTFSQPVDITTDSPAGDYVIHCDGGVAAEGYGPITYVDGTLAVAASPTTTTSTTSSTPDTTVPDGGGEEASSGEGDLPTTGQSSTVPLLVLALTLVSLGAGIVFFERTRRPVLQSTHAFSTTDTQPRVEPAMFQAPVPTLVAPEPLVVHEPVVVEDVIEDTVLDIVTVEDLDLEDLPDDEAVLEDVAVEDVVVGETLVEETLVDEPVLDLATEVAPVVEFELDDVDDELAEELAEEFVVEELFVDDIVADEPLVEIDPVEEVAPADDLAAEQLVLVDELPFAEVATPVVEDLVPEPVAPVVEDLVAEPVAPVVEEIVEEPVVEDLVAEPVAPVVEEIVEEPPVVEVVAPVVEVPVVETVEVAPAPAAEAEEPVAARPAAAAWNPERFALERRLATLEGKTDATSLMWARNIQAKLDALDA